MLRSLALSRPARGGWVEISPNSPIYSNPTPLLVIDRVLMLYLATLNPNERLRALLSCTLPFAICQPFNGDKGLTPDEMFAGRVAEFFFQLSRREIRGTMRGVLVRDFLLADKSLDGHVVQNRPDIADADPVDSGGLRVLVALLQIQVALTVPHDSGTSGT